MDVFDLDEALVSGYAQFARSFTKIRSPDIARQVDEIYATNRFWPEPLISINPHFEPGLTIGELVASGVLHPDTGKVFRIDGQELRLFRHQTQAAAKAHAKQSFVVTTGTGSGKSLCFFIPIIDAAIRAKANGDAPRTRALIIYPMNALANSQMKELQKFVDQSGLPPERRPTFARYTGQETEAERADIRALKPDILLTNFMMLELLMTRQDEQNRAVIENARGLNFIVLDELHTYRGRQGADVAMLVRRLKDRTCRDLAPVCIGTSATMASEGGHEHRAAAVARVASRLFGADVPAEAVIDESLVRATDEKIKPQQLIKELQKAVGEPIPTDLDNAALKRHPLAAWIELEVGLKDGQKLSRREPITITAAAERLVTQTGRPLGRCAEQIRTMLNLMSRPETERGGTSDRAFLAFKLHQFISGAGFVHTTLHDPSKRHVTVEGQRFDPRDPDARLYPTFFCRSCGQEHHPVSIATTEAGRCVLPRSIDDTPIEDEESDEDAGYLMLEPVGDTEYTYDGSPESMPEDWTEPAPGGALRIRTNRHGMVPQQIHVHPSGLIGEGGRTAWFSPGRFKFCPACRHQPAGQAREINKVASLSAEGRSSTTTILVSAALRWMNEPGHRIKADKRKLLGFTDNRQDAALQAGHFNDFIFVTLLRAAILTAVRASGDAGLAEDEFGKRVQSALGFVASNVARRREWMIDPEIKGMGQIEGERTLARVLAHRVWADQRRGWRFTNPNLEDLGLVKATYLALDELAADEAAFASAPQELRRLPPEQRRQALFELLQALRHGLAISTDALDPISVESIATASRQSLREPWAISQQEQERSRTAAYFIVDAPAQGAVGLREEPLIVRGGPRSGFARRLGRRSLWGSSRLSQSTYKDVIATLLAAAESYQLVRKVQTPFDVVGWQLAANAVRLVGSREPADEAKSNKFFVDLYETLSGALSRGDDTIFGQEGREHTAQVDQERREWRENRFRWESEDLERLASEREKLRQAGEPNTFLPVLFCSPTMELGVDISALNAVYLRNVPPTPANYAQRSGRAGRSGQAALVVTYCAAQSPHDQYYFARRQAMVSGVVRPPALDLASRELIEGHLHAVWLAESGQNLAADIPHVLDLTDAALPVAAPIREALSAPDLVTRSTAIMRRVLKSVEAELTPDAAPWAVDRHAFVSSVATNAADQFSRAFGRWRQLYEAARTQLVDANRKSEMHGLGQKERRQIKLDQAQANEQIALLERGASSGGSDFFTYRYLATEGFLPGYNFPRLPLYAYVPSVGSGKTGGAFLQRARFIAIAEFGPRSLIYHEGRAYRVHKAKLPAGLRSADDGKLATTALFVCDQCGGGHADEVEQCHACTASMSAVHPIRNILRIDNVESRPAERITANDEGQQRQGFDLQTVFAWPMRDGAVRPIAAVARDRQGDILSIDYCAGALISRVNKGLRRRRDQMQFGFGIDPATGRWTGNPSDDETDTDAPDETPKQRVVPIVQDNKNAALIRFPGAALSAVAITTLQNALLRGIEVVFQLEEGEVQAQPTPTRDSRRAILIFEASEGGAGALARLIADRTVMSEVARRALDLMHFEAEAAIAHGDHARLTDATDVQCVKACYRCLLSYYNQTDHELIDRTDDDVKRVLLRLARCEVVPTAIEAGATADPWRAAFAEWKLPAPDSAPLHVGGKPVRLVWRSHLVAALAGQDDTEMREKLGALGYTVIVVPLAPPPQPSQELLDLLAVAS